MPDDRTLVVERFRDELGDWRVCVLTPFGGRVHAPWALALEATLGGRLGLEVQAIWTDDGIASGCPRPTAAALDELLLDPEEIEELVVAQLPLGPVRLPLPRERGPGPAAAPPPARPAHRRSGSSGSGRRTC